MPDGRPAQSVFRPCETCRASTVHKVQVESHLKTRTLVATCHACGSKLYAVPHA